MSTEKDETQLDKFDSNTYATHKTIAGGFLSLALLTSNANQLKIMVEIGPNKNPFYTTNFTLVIVSIILQTSIAILGVFAGRQNINFKDHQKKATKINTAILILSTLTTIINCLIVGFEAGHNHLDYYQTQAILRLMNATGLN